MAVDKDKLEEDASIARFYKIDSKDGFVMEKVKDTYKDVDDYISTYEPLLLEEAKAQIIQDKFLTPANDMDDKKSVSQNDLLLLSKQKYEKETLSPTIYAFVLVESRQPSGFRIRIMYLSGEVTNSNPYAVKPRLRLLNMKSLVTSSSERDRFFYTCKVPNKDFDSFFSDENMKSFAVKEESSSTEAVRNDDVDN
ncbi:unnamed protein product [Prunus armeniaca]|uniref:Uncharacterized protein n=1 Tax=Prunus armeniaca TaxID=36596 RepID=A0A6J5X419_PRUAR|nr:unnamed protein product [Prunus armeniaca]